MFRPYKVILGELLIDWNRRTASAHMSIYYMLLLQVVVVWERMPTLNSRYFHIAASTLFLLCVALLSRACAPCINTRAYILKQRWHAVTCNILTYELMQCGDFNQLTVPWGWPYRAETCRNSKIKCDFNDILGNLNVIVMTFKTIMLHCRRKQVDLWCINAIGYWNIILRTRKQIISSKQQCTLFHFGRLIRYKLRPTLDMGGRIAQSVWRRAMGSTIGVRFLAGARDFSLLHSV
jgi:hypothetical protein